ncbi:MAG TPA: hypothetical protein VK656_02335 [Candidatus Acidoferrum sp.]|nr:hypothetical protein [Candidatus Acidoferrum sp.]
MTEGRGTRAAVGPGKPRLARGSADDSGGNRLAELESRLAKLERSPGLRERGRGLMARVVPEEATHHFRNAGREHLLGVRSIVDFWIERIDDSEGRSTRSTRRESIEID